MLNPDHTNELLRLMLGLLLAAVSLLLLAAGFLLSWWEWQRRLREWQRFMDELLKPTPPVRRWPSPPEVNRDQLN